MSSRGGLLLLLVGLIAQAFFPAVRAQSAGHDWYVAPSGVSTNDGSIAHPLDLATALRASSSPARPGDRIWLRGGTYAGNFTSDLAGTSSAPIVVRQYPGERATIDGAPNLTLPGLTVNGSDTWYWGFEVTNSNPQRLQVGRNAGVNVFGARTKFINLIVHDAGLGFGLWSSAVDSEIYGSVIYNIGWEDTSQGTGHSIYTQNSAGTRRLTDNILFNGFSFGIHAYTEGGAIDNMDWEGNVAFNHGVLSAKSGAKANFLLGGRQVAHNAVILNNYLYQSPGVGGRHLDIGYGTACDHPTIQGNYAARSAIPIALNCTNAVLSGNTFIGPVSGTITTAYPNNVFQATPPTGLHTAVRPNRYEAGRGHVIIYNWDHLPNVSVDVSALGLSPGDVFEVRDAQNYFAGPVLVGAYSGGSITFPMTGLTVAAPIGNAPLQPAHTAPEFAAFVVKRAPSDGSAMPPWATLGAAPTVIATGQSATLTWSSALATSVSIDQGIGPVAASGSLTVQPATTTTYTLTASNAVGTVTSSATVTVSAAATVTFVRSDSTTRGTWQGVYGADGYDLATVGVSLPGYAQVALVGQSEFMWTDNTSDVRALQKPAGGRRAATWFASSPFSIDVTVTDGRSHSVALYNLDWDGNGRIQGIDVIDAVTNIVLDSRTVNAFSGGQYLVWTITDHVRFRITNSWGPNGVISGIFFDTPGGGTSLPTATLNATPSIVAPGNASTLSWSTSNATSISIDQGVGLVSASGSRTVNPSVTTTYTLTAQNSAGTATAHATVTVMPVPTASLTVTPTTVTAGQPASLSWSTANATSMSIDHGIGTVAATGSLNVTPSATATYMLTASNAVGTASASATVTVSASGPSNTAQFVRADSLTEGSWRSTFGTEGYMLAQEGTALPSYAQASLSGQSSWVWNPATTDLRGLEHSTGSGRFAATWHSSTTFAIDVTIGGGTSHSVALYMVDWDSSVRGQTIDVTDPVTNALLDRRVVANFQNGLYLVWQVSGSVRFRVTRTSGANAVISGIFFDGMSSGTGGGGPVRFVRIDSTTKGSWQGIYGAQGHAIASADSAPPAYAGLSWVGSSDFVWSANTSDVRGLQKADGSGRIAAAWYSGTGFILDVTITDGQNHAVALYLLDWDSPYRIETIDVIDATTSAVLDSRSVGMFQSGVYLVWQVSRSMRFRVSLNGGANAVVSGIFFDAP